MRKFDHEGLILAEYQGKIFEKSGEMVCSSPVFIRRFLHSDLLKTMDKNSSVRLDIFECLKSITNQFGETSYGQEKYSGSSLFWMGYMYRYIAYTREQTTSYVMKLFSHKQMNSVYYSFHTQDPEWCIRNLLDLNNLTEKVFDKNYRLKEVIRRKGAY